MTYSDGMCGLLQELASNEISKETVKFGVKSIAEMARLVIQRQKQTLLVDKNVDWETLKADVEVAVPITVSSGRDCKRWPSFTKH